MFLVACRLMRLLASPTIATLPIGRYGRLASVDDETEAADVSNAGDGDPIARAVDSVDDLTSLMRDASAAGRPLDATAWLDLRARVGNAYRAFNEVAADIDAELGLTSAKARLRAYLVGHIGEVVTNDQLSGVAGVHEWARRMRELELEQGWRITAGPDDGLRVGTYRLDASEVDAEKAEHWRRRNEIRRRDTSARDRLIAYLSAVFPAAATKDDLAYVARISEWPRRMRELEEEGWGVVSSVDDPTLAAGSYRLESLEQGPPRKREAIKQRAEILRRDGWSCRDCGAGPRTVPGTVLQVHHVHQVNLGGSNDDRNLLTLCRPCHAGRHAIGAEDIARVRDELLEPAADLGPEA